VKIKGLNAQFIRTLFANKKKHFQELSVFLHFSQQTRKSIKINWRLNLRGGVIIFDGSFSAEYVYRPINLEKI